MGFDLFIEYNFAAIIGLIFQILILSYSKNFTKIDRHAFYIAIILETFELITYNLEFMYSCFEQYYYFRTLLSVCGYLVRPMLVYPFIMLIRNYSKYENNKYKYLDLIPFGILLIIEAIALEPTNHLVFYFTEDNIFKRGPLGYASQVVSIIYLFECILQIIISSDSSRKISTSLLIVIFLYCTFSMLFESIFNIRSLGVNACICSVILFMCALQSSHLNAIALKLRKTSEEDALSGLSNRYFGETTINNLLEQKKCGYFFILDVDKFKSINDTYGHYVGDEAIQKVAMALKKCSDEKDVVMRLGGDEFAIYSYRDLDVKEFSDRLFKEINDIKLTDAPDLKIEISMGGCNVLNEKELSFDKIYKLADDKLYEAKKVPHSYLSY